MALGMAGALVRYDGETMTKPVLAGAADSVLILIDVQERLAAAMEPAAFRGVVRNSGILVQAAAGLGIPVLTTEQYRKGLGRTVPELAALLPDAAAIEKTGFSAVADESFRQALDRAGRPQAILAGMEAHVCVLQTALELRADGRDVFVVADACCSRSAANHGNAMERLRAAGVTVANTESIVFEWLRDARHDCFKAISALVR
jgi:nicotinamidase-related amidase